MVIAFVARHILDRQVQRFTTVTAELCERIWHNRDAMARELFGTRVRLDGTTESGRITLFYYNSDDLQRIWDVLEMAKEK